MFLNDLRQIGPSLSSICRSKGLGLSHPARLIEHASNGRQLINYSSLSYRKNSWKRNHSSLRSLNRNGPTHAHPLYTPLNSSSTQPLIRLLELLPSSQSQPVSATLLQVPLSDHLLYEAVSYCWGDPEDVGAITCNGQSLLVPRRLEFALRNMRYPDKSRILWADAICINQRDVAEKESQVQLMRRIFSSAQRTLIWLGDDDEKHQQKMSHFALATIKMGLSMFRRRIDNNNCPQIRVWSKDEGQPRILAPFSTEFYLDLIGILRMSWFQRAWVVQEVAVSSKATIFWGSSQYDWDEVLQALRFMSQQNFPLGHIVTLEDISTIDEERRYYRKGDSRLNDVLLRHQRCLATDPRDKIYSFCGLVETSSSSHTPIRITYEDNVADVFREVAVQILQQDRSLGLLSRPPMAGTSKMAQLPSWVPDWSISSSSTLTYAWGHGPLSLAGAEVVGQELRFSVAGRSTYSPKISNSNTTLAVDGFEFDRIVEVGPVFLGVQLPQAVESFPAIVQDWIKCIHGLLQGRKVFMRWQQVAQVRSQMPYATGETLHEAFLQTVSAAEVHDSERVKIELELWEKSTRFTFGILYSAFIFVWHFLTDKPFLLFEIQGRYALQRRVVRTEGGYLGLVSHETEVGDVVVICKGSSVPLILRRMEGSDEFRLVGDAYIHGVMRGEAFEESKCREILIS